MEYVQLLSEAELQSLRRFSGAVYPSCTRGASKVYRQAVVASVFSLYPGQHEYCVIESDWNDTPNEYLDYHEMHIELRDWPKRVARDSVSTAFRTREGR